MSASSLGTDPGPLSPLYLFYILGTPLALKVAFLIEEMRFLKAYFYKAFS